MEENINTSILEKFNSLQTCNKNQGFQLLEELQLKLSQIKFDELINLTNKFFDKHKLINIPELKTEYANLLLEQFVNCVRQQKSLSIHIQEEQIYKLAKIVAEFGDSADYFTLGYTMALEIFPESNKILNDLLNNIYEHNYFVENAFVGAENSTLNNNRRFLLRGLYILCQFRIDNNYSAQEQYNYLDRNWAEAKKIYSAFSTLHLLNAKKFILLDKTRTNWNFPNINWKSNNFKYRISDEELTRLSQFAIMHVLNGVPVKNKLDLENIKMVRNALLESDNDVEKAIGIVRAKLGIVSDYNPSLTEIRNLILNIIPSGSIGQYFNEAKQILITTKGDMDKAEAIFRKSIAK